MGDLSHIKKFEISEEEYAKKAGRSFAICFTN
jgi:hypothetical protein